MLSPSSAVAGGPSFTLTVNGSTFVSGSVVRWNGASRTTTFVSATQLTAAITAADIAAAGSASVTVQNPGGAVSNALTFTITGSPGAITREVWTGIGGTTVANIPVAAAPNITDTLPSFEAPTNWANNYGTRMRGYITAPVTGRYTFWIASDDNGELWLSLDGNPANKVRIGWVSGSGWTNSRQWNKYSSQKSAARTLTQGQRYYVEALQKEAGGGDNFAVGWAKPGESTSAPSEVIPGSVLSLFNETAGPEINVLGNGTTIIDGDTTPSGSDHTDFGSIDFSSGTVTRTFITQNLGTGSLTVNPVTLSGAHAADFSVIVQPASAVAAGGNTSLQVRFNPSAVGTRTATLSVGNNDANENPYDFALQGTGATAGQTYFANTAVFDGTNDWMRLTASSVTGLADGNDVTLSCWIKFTGNGADTHPCIFIIGNSVNRTRFCVLRVNSTGKIEVYAENSSNVGVIDIVGSTSIGNSGAWIHLYVCIDLTPATSANCKMYINGVPETITTNFYTSGATIDLVAGNSAKYNVGADQFNTGRLQASLAELWINDTYLDDPTKFASGGHPISLGTTGTLPTGSQPVWYFKGDGNAFNVNSGTGGNMTVTGSLGTDPPGP